MGGDGSGKLQISQGLEILVPKTGPAYPIPCGEWDHLKERLQRVSSRPWLFHSIGFLLLGGGLSTLIGIFLGTFKAESKEYVIAWAVVAVAAICGLGFLLLANQQRKLQVTEAEDVVKQMELIEQRYDRVKV